MARASIRTWEGDDPGEVTEAERDEIVDNIQRAFDARGWELVIGEPLDLDERDEIVDNIKREFDARGWELVSGEPLDPHTLTFRRPSEPSS